MYVFIYFDFNFQGDIFTWYTCSTIAILECWKKWSLSFRCITFKNHGGTEISKLGTDVIYSPNSLLRNARYVTLCLVLSWCYLYVWYYPDSALCINIYELREISVKCEIWNQFTSQLQRFWIEIFHLLEEVLLNRLWTHMIPLFLQGMRGRLSLWLMITVLHSAPGTLCILFRLFHVECRKKKIWSYRRAE